MTYPVPYDPKPDLDAFYGALASSDLGRADPDSVMDLVDRVAAVPGQASRSLRFPPDTPADAYRDSMLSVYCAEAARVPDAYDAADAVDIDAKARRLDGIAYRVSMPVSDVAAAADDPVAFDRMMETYYRS